MLFKIDRRLRNKPSMLINLLTGGSKGSTLCSRLYLYHRYIQRNNKLVNALRWIIDSLEPGHCKASANNWKNRHLKNGCSFPKKYTEFL